MRHLITRRLGIYLFDNLIKNDNGNKTIKKRKTGS